ncbi:PD-(D/E)XK nuclease family protein [Dysgonomonadaceae bacterium zrk40]|nr:PD-(D/E)XK nuclease family protein [Dysgonomonadaceae bacterium zrk40]
MIPFLTQVAALFHQMRGNELYKETFVFPNRRAGVFFQKYLAEIAGKPLFSPRVITISELFTSLSPYRSADRIEMLVTLYNRYREISRSEESFDDFLYWGEMLLNDFDDTDKYLADARQLYRNVHDYRSLDDDLSHLTEEQIMAIRRFWNHFMPIEGNETKERFHQTWKILYDLYSSFRDSLKAKGVAYEGMMFREVAERAKRGDIDAPDNGGVVFVGLNALTPAETVLMEHLRNRGVADFYWDYDSPLVQEESNRASFRVKENLLRFPSKHQLPFVDQECVKPQVELVGISSGVGQARHVTRILSELAASGRIPDPDEAINTAIVLPDENLLLPVLYSIPREFGKINVTMGYGLTHASVASLVEQVALLQQNLRSLKGETAFFHRYVKALLRHPLISSSAQVETEQLLDHILKYNRIVVPRSEIPPHPLLQMVFTPVSRWEEIPDYLKSIFIYLYQHLTGEKHAEDQSDDSSRSIDLEREFIVQYYKTVTRLQDRLREVEQMTIETCFRLLRNLARGISVAFSGEPLSGLQVMGVLETRALDFENLIILSMNEGVFPQKNATTSYIPYSLRKGFGLPTYEQQDSTYAYHFYRMISRARRIFLLYDTRTGEEMQTGEVSRYFYQMKYLYHDAFQITERVATYDVSAPKVPPVMVAKSDEVMRKLDAFRAGNERSFSASLLNNYVNCPLQFYFTALEGLSEEDTIEESVEADVFGSIFHRLMETLYNRYMGKVVTPDVLNSLTKDEALLNNILENAFARYYFRDEANPRPLEGQHYLIGEILKSYVKQTLKFDKQFTPFTYIASEYRFKSSYRVSDQLEVSFKGSIDRVDRVGESLRIIDYKTGKGETGFKEMARLFDASKANRPYQILQALIYALFYLQENPGERISPALYYLRSVYDQFDPVVRYGTQPVNDFSLLLPEFRQHFDALMEEIFNPDIPFTQTDNEKICEWCAFKELCNR